MPAKLMDVKRLLPKDVIVHNGEVYEIGKSEVVVEPHATYSTDQLGQWIDGAPVMLVRLELINRSVGWRGFLWPDSGDWLECDGDIVIDTGTFPPQVKIADPDWDRK